MRSDRRALVVGIESYKILPHLAYAGYDAYSIRDLLQDYSTQFSCTLLLDTEATAANIRKSFKELFAGASDDALLLFYFAGHGVTVDGGTSLVTLDSEEDFEDGVYFQRLADIVEASRKPKQAVILILDCCHAGALDIGHMVVTDKIQEIVSTSVGIVLLAATEEDDVAVESDDLQHGVFTYWLCEGLKGKAANQEGCITSSSLHDYVSNVMSQRGYKQQVVFKTTLIGNAPIIGQGFPPQTSIDAQRLTETQLQNIDGRIKDNLALIQQNISHDYNVWATTGYSTVSRDMETLIEWRENLESSHPELKSYPPFRQKDQEIIRINGILAELQPGMRLPHGEVIKEIGVGGFGKVYAVQTSSGIEAYKVYHTAHMHDRDKVKAFKRGYNAMRQLDHPNIVKVIRETKAPLGFYMQYIEGSNFRDWWTEDIPKIIHILHIVAQTLEYAHFHSKQVVHRDIKPENIIIISDADSLYPIPYLTDFDLAWYSMATTFSSVGATAIAAFGHYLYAAPEQYESPGADITKKPTTDVYGFGQLCYFAVCGKDPARDAGVSTEALKARLNSWISAEAANRFLELYINCIKRTPSQRYKSMSEISSVLLDIRRILLDPDKDRLLSENEFITELTFGFFGLDANPKRVFPSKSERTLIELHTINKHRVILKFEVQSGYVAMTGTFETQRNNINRRIDDVLSGTRQKGMDATRHTEKINDVFNCKIDINGHYLTLEGVNQIRELILLVIRCIEQ